MCRPLANQRQTPPSGTADSVLGQLTKFGLETRSVTTTLVGWALQAPHDNLSR
jgi:hypothetical protein